MTPLRTRLRGARVKICGIRTIEAAIAAIEAGADFLGFNFVANSSRRIHIDMATKIASMVYGKVKLVGVFQDQKIEKINQTAKILMLDFVQLHGKENNEYIAQIRKPVIKSFTLLDNPEIIQAKYLMLDRVVQGQGAMVDLQKAALLAKNFLLFLAGGLTPENVKEIVKKVQPYAVDVAGGVETDGVQDVEKIRKFIERAKI